MKSLKVYGWSSNHRGEQTREIVAATSMAMAARLSGNTSPRQMWCLCETGNEIEIAVATHYPIRGQVCWKPLNERDPIAWKRDPLREIK